MRSTNGLLKGQLIKMIYFIQLKFSGGGGRTFKMLDVFIFFSLRSNVSEIVQPLLLRNQTVIVWSYINISEL